MDRVPGVSRPTRGWYARRGIVVADDLATLRGPRTGRFRLPLSLDGSARTSYDLADQSARELVYRIVMVEAASQDDLAAWLDGPTLVACWPQLYLPREIRSVWETRHPVLAARGAGPDVPSASARGG